MLRHMVESYLNESEQSYVVRQIQRGKPSVWEVSSFSDDNEPDSVYEVTFTGRTWTSNSPATRHTSWSPDRDKHVRLVRYWIDVLDSKIGAILYFDGDQIKHRDPGDIF